MRAHTAYLLLGALVGAASLAAIVHVSAWIVAGAAAVPLGLSIAVGFGVRRAKTLGPTFARFARAELTALSTLGFLAAWLVESMETAILLRIAGIPMPVAAVLAVETALSLARSAVAFVPGGLGVQDLGYATALAALGAPHDAAAAFVILKRAKELFWIAIGLAVSALARHGDVARRHASVPAAFPPARASSAKFARMARPFFVALALAVTGTFAFSCGSGKAPDSGDGGDAGNDDAAVQTLTYSPSGCGYAVTPPASRGYVDLALDDTSAPSGDVTPARVRLGLGGGTDSSSAATYANPSTSAAFTWETAVASHAAKVKLGTDANTLSDVHTGYTWTTPRPTIGFSSGHDKYMHEVHVCGLQPGTTYYYQVGGGPTGSEVWSATQSFTTVPATGSLMVGVQGDARDQVSTWQLVQERMKTAGVSMQLVVGDIVDIGSLEDLWAQWLDAIWKDPNDPAQFLTLGEEVLLPIAGNHEAEAAQFYANWAIPGDSEQYASVDVGNTHFVMVDDQFAQLQTDFTQAPAKTILDWLKSDLQRADANRAKVPFIVAMSHRGLYSTSLHSTDGDVLAARGALAPIYDQFHVDLVFNGHDHEYERSAMLHANTTDPKQDPTIVTSGGTTYVIAAGAGAEPYAVGTSSKPYSLKQQAFGGTTPYIGDYVLLTLSGNTLKMDAYGLKASGTDDVIDTLTLTH